jgi:hypothetical protein
MAAIAAQDKRWKIGAHSRGFSFITHAGSKKDLGSKSYSLSDKRVLGLVE